MSSAPSPKSDHFGQIVHLPRRTSGADGGAKLTREEKRTRTLAQTLPAGITISERRDGRGKPFYVRFGKDRTLESFATEESRNDRAQQLADGVKTEGSAVLAFDPAKWRALQRFEERTGVTIEQAEDIVVRVRGNLRLNLTTSEAVAAYVKLREAEEVENLSHAGNHLKRFCVDYGHLPLFVITPDNVRDWLASLRLAPFNFGSVTVRHHRKNLHAFFERAVLEKWTLENPVKAVAPPKVDDKDVTVLAPREVFNLLKANVRQPIVGRIALELYGFMRCSSVERILESHVRWEARGIVMRGMHTDEEGERQQGHKSGKRKFRQRHAPVMWEWLEHADPLGMWEEVYGRGYDEKKAEAFTRAHVKNPGNVLRHTCASVYLAATANPPFVSYMMQHTSLSMTEKYEGVYEETAAKMVLAMTPAAVKLSWPVFCKRWETFYQPIPITTP